MRFAIDIDENSNRQTQQATPAGGGESLSRKEKTNREEFFKCGTVNPLLTAKLDHINL